MKRFPPRIKKLPAIKLPKIKLQKPTFIKSSPPKTTYNSKNVKTTFDVKIVPGSSFDIVKLKQVNDTKENDIEVTADEPKYSYVVDISSPYEEQAPKSTSTASSTFSSEPQIIYGVPDTSVSTEPQNSYRVPESSSSFSTSSDITTEGTTSFKYQSKINTKQTLNSIKIPTDDLQDGFMPSKQFIKPNVDSKVTTTEETQTNLVPEPIIKSTFQQNAQSPSLFSSSISSTSNTPPMSTYKMYNQPPPTTPPSMSLYNPHPSFVQPRPLPPFKPFQEFRSLPSLPRPPSKLTFQDTSPNFQTFFPRQFQDKFVFSGFPLSRIHPPAVMSNIAMFSSDTNLVDSKSNSFQYNRF